ncbi:MAG: nucleotide exchange factor GrpE [Gammaproteobacteria bacterium]|nr:nucleotide exchange factor GrpE [Gammaproteobacteria bacterium]
MSNNNEITEESVVSEGDVIDSVGVNEAVLDTDPVQAEISALKEALGKAEQKAAENYDLALRTKAEAENTRRRQETALSNAKKFSVEKFAQDLLPILDSMEMGLGAALEGANDVAKFREGSEIAIKMFQTALEKVGAVQVDPQGEKFNPELHQAMSMVENVELAPNTVMNVIQRGYTLHGRLMRPAMVIVSKGGPAVPPSTGQIDEIV